MPGTGAEGGVVEDFAVQQGDASTCVSEEVVSALNEKQVIHGEPIEQVGLTAVLGRLEVLNGHGSLSGRLWEADGTAWTCQFKRQHVELLPDAWLHTVELSGKAIVTEGRERVLEVESILVNGQDASLGKEDIQELPFWQSLSLEELIERQAVSPVDNLDEIASLWPEEHDPDLFLQHIMHERSHRRRLGTAVHRSVPLLTHDGDLINRSISGLQVISYLDSVVEGEGGR